MNKNKWILCATAILSFVLGPLLTGVLAHSKKVSADTNRVFELMIYHANPGKGTALESVFRDAYKIMAQHGINVVGYWVPNEDPAWSDTFVYVVAHPSRLEAEKNWNALHTDPAFRPYIEAAKPLIQKPENGYKVDEIYMRPTDFSAIR